MRLSVLYCTKNEAEFIELSVAAVAPFVDEIIIFDTLSTDGTLEIAREMAVKDRRINVISHHEDFDAACEFNVRNLALKHCTQEWIAVLDADQLLSDNWLKSVYPLMQRKELECIGIRYEHLVGSYEYVHKPECGVPSHVWCLFRNTPHLQCRPAAEVCSWAKPQHHASHERSCRSGSLIKSDDVMLFHYGFAKRGMMGMAIYRANRGDHGHEPDVKTARIKELQDSGNPFLFCGPVERVKYGKDHVPSVMRDAFDNTYRLVLDESDHIKDRIVIATGERG